MAKKTLPRLSPFTASEQKAIDLARNIDRYLIPNIERMLGMNVDEGSGSSGSIEGDVSWFQIAGKPEDFPTSWGLISDKPATFPPSTHTHPASAITSGEFDDGRVAKSNVTQHIDDDADTATDIWSAEKIATEIEASGVDPEDIPYDFRTDMISLTGGDDRRILVVRASKLLLDDPPSRAGTNSAPSGAVTFDIEVNGNKVGDFTFADSETEATFTRVDGEVDLVRGDLITIVSPGALSGLGDVYLSLSGHLVEEVEYTITQNDSGVVDSDDFNRANENPIGTGWTELLGTWQLVDNALRSNTGSGDKFVQMDGVSLNKVFVYCSMRSDSSGASLIARLDYNGGSRNSYEVWVSTFGNNLSISTLSNGSGTSLADEPVSGGVASHTFFPRQFYLADGVQEAWTGAGDGDTIASASSTYLNGVSGGIGFRGRNNPDHVDYVVVCKDKVLSMDGLPAGFKVKVRNADGDVVAEDVESGGSVSVDLSRFSEIDSPGSGATEDPPPEGFADMVVTTPLDGIVATFNASGVYPGGDYTLSVVP